MTNGTDQEVNWLCFQRPLNGIVFEFNVAPETRDKNVYFCHHLIHFNENVLGIYMKSGIRLMGQKFSIYSNELLTANGSINILSKCVCVRVNVNCVSSRRISIVTGNYSLASHTPHTHTYVQ